MALQLKRTSVAEKYELTVEPDFEIHVGCYNGLISNINECGAKQLLQSKSPYIIEKPLTETDEEGN